MNEYNGYNDPNDERNSEKYHSGRACVEPGCPNPAGTAWSPHWCFECNVKRIDKINSDFNDMVEYMEQRRAEIQRQGGRIALLQR